MHIIPQSWSHLHMLVGVFPSFGLLFVLGFYVAGLATDNKGVNRTCLALFGMLALLSVPTYLSGTGSMAALAGDPKVASGLVFGLAIVALGLMVVADGWEINHSELQATVVIPDVSTPPEWPHVHMIINHFPTVGFVFAIVFLLIGRATRNDLMTRGSLVLFVLCGIVGVPTYVSGTATMWALTQPPKPEISKA